ncbi:toll/interleukin-1 receptor domain-containing protein [Sphingobium fuliginis]|nr:toll/interleukin-1 receptor domain-containing protein [Sphingobium fuliginis]
MRADSAKAAYTAFLSYNHRDVRAARGLQRRLESYRLPKGAMRSDGERRLGPIFRDRDELPAAADLSEAVKQALSRSAALVVLCSPHAAASPWVDKEIRLFRFLHPDRPILAAIIEGEPEEAFPPALQDGGEPLAADLRREGDGVRLGTLKIIAGLAGIGLDRLVQRDAQRRVRRVTAVTLA